MKQQWEKKHGDSIRGHYSLVEPDGTVRIVDYTADSKSGFNAVVKHKGTSYHQDPHSNHKATSHKTFEMKPGDTEVDHPQYAYKYVEAAASVAAAPLEHKELEQDQETYEPDVKYVYIPQGDKIDGAEYDFSSQGAEAYPESKGAEYVSEATQTKNVYTKYKNQPPQIQLPVDLSLLKPKQNIEAVDVSLVKPIEVDFHQVDYEKKPSHNVAAAPVIPYAPGKEPETTTRARPGPVTFPADTSEDNSNVNKNNENKQRFPHLKLSQAEYQNFLKDYYKDAKINASLQVSDEEYQKFLSDYYKDDKTNVGSQLDVQNSLKNIKNNPQVEYQTGFKPVLNSNRNVVSKGTIPNTFRTNVKPVTTPGLRNYSSGNAKFKSGHRPKLSYQNYLGNKNVGSGLYLNYDNDLKGQYLRKHSNSGRVLRYAVRRSFID